MTKHNFADILNDSLTRDQRRLLERVRDEATRDRLPLYIVGGSVRDLVLGRRLNDFDLTVEGDAIMLARALAARYGGRVTGHTKFGTAKWFLPDDLKSDHPTLDLITARSERYKHPAALPTVRPGSIADDLRRRDVTINALAIRLDDPHYGELRDDLGGLDDIERGLVRVLYPDSFRDDPTRMYRAVRYEGRYAFKIAQDTLALLPAAIPYVEKLSAQRIRHELDLVLDEPNAAAMLMRLAELDLLAPIHPALATLSESSLARLQLGDPVLQNRTSRWMLWLMDLPVQEIESLNGRLHFSAELLKILRSASLLGASAHAWVRLKPSQVVDALEGYSFKALEVASVAARDAELKSLLTRYLTEWWHRKPVTTGHDLKRLGIPPGPKYNEILRRLRTAWLDGDIKTEEDEKRLLDRLRK